MATLRKVTVLTSLALAVLAGLTGLSHARAGGDDGALPDVEALPAMPPYEGERRDCIADALEKYAEGDVYRAWAYARTVARRKSVPDADREAALAFVAFIDKLGEEALAAVDRSVEAEEYLRAMMLLVKTEERFGRHDAGREAGDLHRTLKRDKAIRNRIEAQEMLREIRRLLFVNEPDRAKGCFARLERRYPDLPETADAREGIENFDPEEAARREALKYAFGTVTSEKRVPGALDCKGSCSRLEQGGYMKFALGDRAAGSKIKSGTLRVYVEKWSGNHWRWLTHIPSDPTRTRASTVFDEVQKQATKFSGVITLREPSGWLDVRLNPAAIEAINRVLANPDPKDRWIAIAFGFE